MLFCSKGSHKHAFPFVYFAATVRLLQIALFSSQNLSLHYPITTVKPAVKMLSLVSPQETFLPCLRRGPQVCTC